MKTRARENAEPRTAANAQFCKDLMLLFALRPSLAQGVLFVWHPTRRHVSASRGERRPGNDDSFSLK